MKWRTVYRVIPVPVFYTDNMPDGVGAYAKGPAVWVRTKYQNDEGIHRHELEHVRQFWTLPIVHGFLYQASDRYRLWAEVRAYKEQMRYPDRDGVNLSLDGAAARLMNPRYRLKITLEEAKEKLA